MSEVSYVPSAHNLFALDGLVAVVNRGGSPFDAMIGTSLASNSESVDCILDLPNEPLEEVARDAVSHQTLQNFSGVALVLQPTRTSIQLSVMRLQRTTVTGTRQNHPRNLAHQSLVCNADIATHNTTYSLQKRNIQEICEY
jgi:hypothetical protein